MTLLEIMVVLALLSLSLALAGVALPSRAPEPEAPLLDRLRVTRTAALRSGRPAFTVWGTDTVWFNPDGTALGGPLIVGDGMTMTIDPMTGSASVSR